MTSPSKPVDEGKVREAVRLLSACGVCFGFEGCRDVDEDEIVEMAKDYEAFSERLEREREEERKANGWPTL